MQQTVFHDEVAWKRRRCCRKAAEHHHQHGCEVLISTAARCRRARGKRRDNDRNKSRRALPDVPSLRRVIGWMRASTDTQTQSPTGSRVFAANLIASVLSTKHTGRHDGPTVCSAL